MKTRKLAQILAREVMYRSRRTGYKSFSFLKRDKVGAPSALKSNALGAIFFSIISLTIISPLFYAAQGGANVENLFIELSVFLIMFEALMSLLLAISFTSTFINEKLVEALKILPLREKEILRAYVEALLLYWGGLSNIFTFLPGMLLAVYFSTLGYLPIIQPLLGIISGFLVLSMSYSIGIAIGTFSSLVKKRKTFRFISAIAWLLVFVLLYSGSSLLRFITPMIGEELSGWIALIPFIGLLAAHRNILEGLFSTIVSLMIIYCSYKIALSKLKKLLTLEPKVSAIIPKAGFKVEKPAAKLSIKSRGFLVGFMVKDFKLLGREPRRLANVLYMLILPIMIFLPTLISKNPGEAPSFLLVMPSIIFGFFSGTIVSLLFYIESSGARVLYMLPLTRRKLALVKAAEAYLLALPGAAIILALNLYLAVEISQAIANMLFVVLASLTTSIAISSLTVWHLPEAPSDWTEASMSRFYRGMIYLAYYALLMVVTFVILFSIKYLLLAFVYTSIAYIAISMTLFLLCAKKKPI